MLLYWIIIELFPLVCVSERVRITILWYYNKGQNSRKKIYTKEEEIKQRYNNTYWFINKPPAKTLVTNL